MKKIYNNFLFGIQKTIKETEVFKMYVAENYALYKKRSLYSHIDWSKEQLSQFNEFWHQHYGKKITPNGHKLYQSVNDVYNKKYFPDFLYATKLEPKLNNYFYAKLYSDKSLTEILYAKSPLAKFPKTYLVNCNGVFYNSTRKIISSIEANKIFTNLENYVLKPTIGGNSGKGVVISNNSELNKFDLNQKDYIIQEKMIQHESISKIYSDSINTIRVITYNLNGKTYCAPMALRIGSGGSKIDNIHAGGLVVGVKNNGELLKYAYKLGYSDQSDKFTHHPDSGLEFHQYKVNYISKIPEVAIELHGLTPQIGIISWDFMIDQEGSPVIIEANYWGQSVWFPQIVHAKPIFGDQTEEIIHLIKKK